MTPLDRLWGGQLHDVALDVAQHIVRFTVSTLTAGIKDMYEIVCRDVRELHFLDEILAEWDYAEVTTAVGNVSVDGSILFEMTMWTENTGIRIQCGEVRVNDEAIKLNDP